MEKIQTPPPIEDVIRRRIRSAPLDVRQAALNCADPVVAVWIGDNLCIVSLSNASFVAALDLNNKRHGSPLPQLIPEHLATIAEPSGYLLHHGQTHIHISFSDGPTDDVEKRMMVLQRARGLLSFFFDGQSRPETAFVAGIDMNAIDWFSVAESLENNLVKLFAPYIEEVPVDDV